MSLVLQLLLAYAIRYQSILYSSKTEELGCYMRQRPRHIHLTLVLTSNNQ